MIAVYACETSTISGTGFYTLNGAYADFQTWANALSNEQDAPVTSPQHYDDVGYTAWTTTNGAFDGPYENVEVGRGEYYIGANNISRADIWVSYSTNSNNRVDWPGSQTIYVAITLNNYDLEI